MMPTRATSLKCSGKAAGSALERVRVKWKPVNPPDAL